MVQINFDANNVEPAGSFAPLPEGEYLVKAEECELKTSKADSKYLKFKFVVCQGEYEKRTIYHNINKWHTNEIARKIAEGELSAICHATGVMTPRDTAELLGIPLVVRVIIERDKNGQYPDKNVIKAFKSRKANTPKAVKAVPEQDNPWQK
jgi:hypothetical protein